MNEIVCNDDEWKEKKLKKERKKKKTDRTLPHLKWIELKKFSIPIFTDQFPLHCRNICMCMCAVNFATFHRIVFIQWMERLDNFFIFFFFLSFFSFLLLVSFKLLHRLSLTIAFSHNFLLASHRLREHCMTLTLFKYVKQVLIQRDAFFQLHGVMYIFISAAHTALSHTQHSMKNVV